MDELTEHAIGLPKSFEWHPFRFIDFKEQAKIQRRPVSRNPTKVAERGRRFYFDFGFIRASNDDFSRPTKEKDRVVESYDGFTSYLLIVDKVSKYSGPEWDFDGAASQVSKYNVIANVGMYTANESARNSARNSAKLAGFLAVSTIASGSLAFTTLYVNF